MPNPLTWSLPADLETAVTAALREWTAERRVARLWARDAALWTGDDEARWLGWLGIVDEQLGRVAELQRIAEDVRQAGFTHVLLLGMGGSSLCPEVLALTFGKQAGWPELSVLDSTDPAQVRAAEARVDLGRTLFVVSSKSGHDARAEHLQAVLLRTRETDRGSREGGRSVRRDHGSRLEARAGRPGGRLPPRPLRAAVHRRPLLRALRLRDGAGRPDGRRRLAAAPCRADDDAGLRGRGAGRGQSRRRARGGPGCPGQPRTRQGHAGRLAGDPRPGRLARAAPGGVHREGGQGPDPGRPGARSGRRTSTAATACSSTCASIRRPTRPGSPGRGPTGGGTARRPDRGPGGVRDRGGVLSLGVRDGRRRVDPRDQSLRPARRRGQQGRDAAAHRRVREDRALARRDADPRSRGHPALRRSAERARSGGRRPDARWRPARPPGADPARRLRRAPRLRRDDGRARGDAAGDPHAPPRPAPRRHLPRLRSAVPPLDGAGVQGRAEHGRVPADHLRRRPAIWPCPASATRSAS